MMSPDEYPNHDPGCFRQYVTNIYPDGPIQVIPSFRKRWDCPGCISRKLWDGLQHIAGEDLRTYWEEDRRVRRQAERIGAGYCALSFKSEYVRLIISTPELLPNQPKESFKEILMGCIKTGMEDKRISRLTYNRLWTPEKETIDVLPIPTFSRNRKEVIKAIINAGFPDLDTDGTPLEAVERRIKIRLNGEDLDLP